MYFPCSAPPLLIGDRKISPAACTFHNQRALDAYLLRQLVVRCHNSLNVRSDRYRIRYARQREPIRSLERFVRGPGIKSTGGPGNWRQILAERLCFQMSSDVFCFASTLPHSYLPRLCRSSHFDDVVAEAIPCDNKRGLIPSVDTGSFIAQRVHHG
jgi:hypothetical protein